MHSAHTFGPRFRYRFSCDHQDVSQRQTIPEGALPQLHTSAFDHTPVLGEWQDLRPQVLVPAGEDQPLKSHRAGRTNAAFEIVYPENQNSSGHEC